MAGKVWGFFYGGLIDDAVMDRVGFRPTRRLSAWLPGFALEISPLVNLVRGPGEIAFGLLLETTHAELDHVYGQLKAKYVPIPVLAFDMQSAPIPALCYVVPDMAPGQAEEAHILPLLSSAEKLHFPGWYIARIRSFLPMSTSPRP